MGNEEGFEFSDDVWRLSRPENDGWSIELLEQAEAAIREFGSLAGAVVHRGRLILWGGNLDRKVLVRSVRKSLLSALIGIEIDRGRISLDRTLAELEIDDVPPSLTDDEKKATVEDLLVSRSGVYHDALAESETMKKEKPARGAHPPGSHWYYNNWDFNALGTIYERATGQPVYEGLHDDIAKPIGMQDFSPSDGRYKRGPQSIHPAYHITMTARDLARFGLLYLRNGQWRGRQIVPSAWIKASTKSHAISPHRGGYGYMWWTTGHDGAADIPSRRHLNAWLPKIRYFAQGAYGQLIGIFPTEDLVIVNLAATRERSPEEDEKLSEFVSLVLRALPR